MTTPLPELYLRLGPARDGGHPLTVLRDGVPLADAAQPIVLELDRGTLTEALGPEAYARALAEALPPPSWVVGLDGVESARVRLALAEGARVLHALRWECLPRQLVPLLLPLATDARYPFSRLLHPESTAWARAPETEWPLRVCVAISNPTNLASFNLAAVDVAAEVAELQRALEPLRGLIELEELKPPVTLDRIVEALETQPHIFHFIGHGLFNQRTGEAALLLERARDRASELISETSWAQRLATLPRLPHLIALTACESSVQARQGALVGMAPATVGAGTGAVLAMHDKVGIDTAREFNYHFYRRLATHGVIDRALNEARSYLLDRGQWGWSVPVLCLERGAEQLFAAPPDALEADPAAPDEFLILIPEFTGYEEVFFEVELRDALQTRLAEAQLTGVRVVWLKESRFGAGDEDEVRRLAARYGAGMVLWGWYDRALFRACFTVTESLFTYRDPLAFRAEATLRRSLEGEQAFGMFVNAELPKQVDFFVFFTVGQLYYWSQRYDEALAALDRAIAAVEREAEPPQGLAYAYFYRGNIHAVHRQARPAAMADKERALALKPAFADCAYNLGESRRVWGNQQRAEGRAAEARDWYARAIAAYDQALASDPAHALALEGRGLAHYELEQYERAIADYKAAFALAPRAELLYKLALALSQLQRWEETHRTLTAAIARAPGVADFYHLRARVCLKRGDETGAVRDFEQYLRLTSGENDRRQRVQAWLAARQGGPLKEN